MSDKRAELAKLDKKSADIHARYMRIACEELRRLPTQRIAELGLIVGGTTNSCKALLAIVAMGEDVAEVICTAATATLMTECEARANARKESA